METADQRSERRGGGGVIGSPLRWRHHYVHDYDDQIEFEGGRRGRERKGGAIEVVCWGRM
jgi:hypothetical protein